MKRIIFTLALIMSVCELFAQTKFENISIKDAVAKASKENKLVFIDAYTTWCGPCKFMANTIFPDKTVGAYMNPKFVCVKCNTEEDGNQALVSLFGIDAYPTFLIIGQDGTLYNKFVGSSDDAASFIHVMDSIMNDENSISALNARYIKGENDVDFLKKYTQKMLESGLYPQAKDASLKLFSTIGDNKTSSEYWFIFENQGLSPFNSDNWNYVVSNVDAFKKNVGEEKVNSYTKGIMETLLINIISGRNKNAGVDDIKQIEKHSKELGLNDVQIDGLVAISLGLKNRDAEATVSACEKYLHEYSGDQLSRFYFGAATKVKPMCNASQSKRLLEISKSLIDTVKDDRFLFGLKQFIPYVLEK